MTQLSATFSCRVVLVAAWLAGAVSSATASDWPRFRGPNGTGVSPDSDAPIEFGEEKNLLWKVAIPGLGNSSPIVSKQRIFLQSASENGSERMVLCLDLVTGNTLWTQRAPGGKGVIHTLNSMASSTAAADGSRVFVSFWDGNNLSVAGYDYSGNKLWSRELGAFTSQHGAGHSPIVVGDKVILANDQDGSAAVVALDAAKGTIAWQKTRPAHRACYSTPILLDHPGAAPELLVASTFGVTSYDPNSGSERWQWNWTTNERKLRMVGSPVLGKGQIFLYGGDGKGDRQTVAVNFDGNAVPASIAWEERKLHFPYVPCVLTRGDYLYFVNDAGMAACFVAKTGENVWLNRLGAGNITASPVMVDDRIYAFTENGTAFVLAADPTYKVLATTKLAEGVLASPAVADGRLLVRGRKSLYCFAKTGK